MSTTEKQFAIYYENLIQEISLVAEATSRKEFTDKKRLETAKRTIRLLLRTAPGKYWIPPLAPEDRYLGITKGYFRAVTYFKTIMEAESTSLDEILSKLPEFEAIL